MSAIRDPATITKTGRQMVTAGGDITYTKAVLYGQDISHLTKEQVKGLTSIGDPLVTVPIGISDKNDDGNGTTVVLEATFQNSNLKADLPYKAVGFFAKKDDGDEKLVLVGVATDGAYLAATSPDGVSTDSLDIKIAVAVGDASNVTAVVDPAGSVTPATLNGAISKATHDLTDKINTKADKTDLDSQIGIVTKSVSDLSDTVKANKDDADKTLATKADKATVESDLATKANQSDLDKTNAEVAKKASTTDVNSQLATKADAKDVTDALALKDDTVDVDKKISNVTNSVNSLSSTVTSNKSATDTALGTKANANDVANSFEEVRNRVKKLEGQQELTAPDFNTLTSTGIYMIENPTNGKNSPSNGNWGTLVVSRGTTGSDSRILQEYYPDSGDLPYFRMSGPGGVWRDWKQLSDQSEINSLRDAVNTKADKTDVEDKLAAKADSADVTKQIKTITDLANTKADQTALDATNATVATKANSTDVYTKTDTDKLLDAKADKAAVEQSLSTKANSADVDKKLATKADSAKVDANKKAVDDAIATKADSANVTKQLATKADKTAVSDDLATKADQSSLDATNKVVATKANSADVYTKKQVDDAFSSRDATIANKADKATVDTEISKIDFTPYAKSADVANELQNYTTTVDLNKLLAGKEDAGTSYSKAELDKKLLALSTDTDGKVNADQVSSMIANKVDKSDLASDLKSINDSIATKANASDVADNVKTLQANIDTKADKATVDAEIAKIDFTPYAKSADVDSKLKGYTDTADLTKLLAGKADSDFSYSKAELDKKLLDLTTTTGGKVDASQVATMIENKADKSDVTKQIGTVKDLVNTKANSTDVDAALDKKDDTTDVDAKIKIVTDLANTKANSSDVYTKSAIDTAFSQRDSRIANVTNLANQIDSTRLPLYQGSANEDLKGFFTPQIRMYNNATGVKNIPADCQYQSNFYGTLVVLPDGASNTNDGSQILITPERKAWIAQSNGQGAKSWSDWSRFTLTSDLSALQSALQAKIDAKADASNVYSKSEVDSKTTATIVTGYDIPSKTRQTMSAGVNVKWLVNPSVIDIVADQINQLKGRRTVDKPDFNTLTDGGTYYVTSPSMGKNYPTGAWGTLLVSNGSGHRISQLYFPDDSSAPWTRLLDETTWHNWMQLSTKQDVQNAVNLANASSNKVDTVLANSYFRKQGMDANGNCVEIRGNAIKQSNGGYAFDIWPNDWTASKLKDVLGQLPSKANTSDVNNALNDKANAGDVSALQNKVNVQGNLFRLATAGNTWADILGVANSGTPVLVSIRDQGSGNLLGNFAAAIAFGGEDTKGVLNVAYSDHTARIIGGNGNAPVWHEDIAWKSDINSLNSTISALQQTVQSLQNTVNQQATQITGLQTQVNNQANEIKQLQETAIKGKTFNKSQEAAAEAWEKQNSQQIAFIRDKQ